MALIRNRCAPAIEHEQVVRSLSPNAVIDVGANVGQFSSLVRSCHPTCPLYMFEPLPNALSRLRNVFEGDASSIVFPFALSSAEGTVAFHVSQRPDSSSLLPIGPLQVRENRGTGESRTIMVPTRRLDGVSEISGLPDQTLLKLDVQGAELEVVRGAGELLDHIKWIYCEVSFVELYEGQPRAAELIHALGRLGFELSVVGALSKGRSGRVIQADVLFERTTFALAEKQSSSTENTK
jgi:FkbM family methyltransferase